MFHELKRAVQRAGEQGEDEAEGYFTKLALFIAAHPTAENRLMYGSDWAMLETQKRAKEYLALFIKGAMNGCWRTTVRIFRSS